MNYNNETPDNGANTSGGLSIDEAATRLAALMDTETGATQTDADDGETLSSNEEGEPPQELDNSDTAEQTHEDSDGADDDSEGVGSESEDVAEAAPAISDDAEIDFGGGEKVKVAELKAGYLRHQDYTRKTQETAAERKTYETARTQTIQALYEFQQNAIIALSIEDMQTPEEFQRLAEEDPAEAIRLKAKLERRQQVFQQTQARIQHLQAEEARMAQEAFQQAQADGQRELLRMHPEFATEQGLGNRLGQYLVSQGVPAEEVQANTNPLLFSIALKAMKYDAMQKSQASVKQKIEAKPALVKPGSASNAKVNAKTDFQKDMARLNKTGSADDAAAMLAKYSL